MAFEYIRFADTKAAIILALSTALLGGMITAKVHHYCGPSRIDSSDPHFGATFQGLGALLTFAFLLVSFTAAILALAPRLSVGNVTGIWPTIKSWFVAPPKAQDQGYIFWGEILSFQDNAVYWNAVSTKSKEEIEAHLGKRLYTLSSIADQKFLWVNRGFVFLLLGAILGGLFIVGLS